MADSDYPMDPASHGYMYPDIDENTQYPWQGTQTSGPGEVSASVIDPRLYRDLFPQVPSEAAELEKNSTLSDDGDGVPEEDEGEYPTELYGLVEGEDDSDFVYSEDDSESEDEYGQDGGDESDDSVAQRRRRRGGGRFSGRYGARGGKGIKRGPRKPLEPGPEFKMLHSEATSAFIDGDYDRANDLVMRAIQINPEMFPAHSLLSEIFLAQGQKDKAVTALFNGAHTRPKDPTVWMKVARLILERSDEDRRHALNDVVYCYSRVIEIEPKNLNVRYQRAAVYRELGYNGRAATEYERILRDSPHDTRALRHLAEVFIDLNDVPRAIDHWVESVEYYMSLDPQMVPDFSWSEVNIYVELFSYVGQHEDGLHALKSLARWLLGRKSDTIWEDFEGDDREWDSEDSPRRIKRNGFIPGRWPRDSYGLGLPLELRIKMGLFRLRLGEKHQHEAMHHFEWLNPEDESEDARIFDYGDLFREVADALKEFGLLEEALRFYSPIQRTDEYADVSFFSAMADCCMQLGKLEDAETYYLTVAENDASNMESRAQLAKLYESLGMSEQALKYVNEAVLIGRQESRTRRRRKDARLEQLASEFRQADAGVLKAIAPKPTSTLTGRIGPATGRGRVPPVEEATRKEDVQFLYTRMQQLESQVKDGIPDAVEDWLDIADALLREFRSNRIFYPILRTMEFQGYSSVTQSKADKDKGPAILQDMQDMAVRLQRNLGNAPEEPLSDVIPTEYHGIPFDEWLDMFLQYALLVTDQGEPEEAYENLDAAALASIWFHSKPKLRLIHVCWFTCALRAQDEEALANEARWFIKEYQFVTDTYRLFSMLSRLSGDPHKSLFHSSPNMKFMLRQIKAMDFTLPDEPSKPHVVRQTIWKERASLSTKDDAGNPIPAESLDIALLTLYGHILFSGGSFYPALNYFFRAYALDNQNPAVLLSIALCFIHHSLKRQSENRHYLIKQGLSFMQEYRRVRMKPGTLLQEQQEMEFNFARMWHGLGLSYLAVEAYEKVLKLGQQIQRGCKQASVEGSNSPAGDVDVVMSETDSAPSPTSQMFVENFSREAAYGLQCIYSLGGDTAAAKAVTNEWLVI